MQVDNMMRSKGRKPAKTGGMSVPARGQSRKAPMMALDAVKQEGESE